MSSERLERQARLHELFARQNLKNHFEQAAEKLGINIPSRKYAESTLEALKALNKLKPSQFFRNRRDLRPRWSDDQLRSAGFTSRFDLRKELGKQYTGEFSAVSVWPSFTSGSLPFHIRLGYIDLSASLFGQWKDELFIAEADSADPYKISFERFGEQGLRFAVRSTQQEIIKATFLPIGQMVFA